MQRSSLSDLPVFNKTSFSKATSRTVVRPPTTYFCSAETSKPQSVITTEKTSILHRYFEKLEKQQQQYANAVNTLQVTSETNKPQNKRPISEVEYPIASSDKSNKQPKLSTSTSI